MKNIVKFIFLKSRKKLSIGLLSSGGRNFFGRVCVYHRGGGNKKIYLFIDRYRRLNKFAFVYKIFKHSCFTAFIGMLIYDNGLISYIVISNGLKIGSRIFSGIINGLYSNSIGSSNVARFSGLFSIVNSLEAFPFSGSKLARAAGTSAYIIGKEKDKALIKLNSGWQLRIFLDCMVSFGVVSNTLSSFEIIGKAGKSRALGRRPIVRGVVKNPCDHPHGGGEGKGSPPASQVSPWGRLTKGTPTKNRKSDRVLRRLFKDF